MSLRVNDSLSIEDWEMTESFGPASGPGGQNVNKVATAVELRFEAARSPHLTGAQKARLRRLAGRRWTKEGAVLITAQSHRSQAANREEAREKLAALIAEALIVPKRRRPTRPSLSARRKRMDEKTKRGAVKALRKPPDAD